MPSRPAWANALGPKAATQIGGCGCWTGNGARMTCSPSPTGIGSPRHAEIMLLRHHSKIRRLSLRDTEKASNIAG